MTTSHHTDASHETNSHHEHASHITDVSDHVQKVGHSIFRSFFTSIQGAILLGALLISLSHIGYGFIMRGSSGSSNVPSNSFVGRPIDESDLAIGNTKSDIVVVEYSDTECPFCAQLHPTMVQLMSEYKDDVSFVYRYFPLTQIHPHAFEEARAVFCVGKLEGGEKKREYVNELFSYKTSRKNMTLAQGEKEALAYKMGVQEKAFTSCMKDEKSAQVINDSINEGVAAGVQGTPATFVLQKGDDGYEVVALIDGARPYSYFKAVLDQTLGK